MSYVKNITAHYRQMLMPLLKNVAIWRALHQVVLKTLFHRRKRLHRGSTDYFVNARKGYRAFDSPKFIGLPGG